MISGPITPIPNTIHNRVYLLPFTCSNSCTESGVTHNIDFTWGSHADLENTRYIFYIHNEKPEFIHESPSMSNRNPLMEKPMLGMCLALISQSDVLIMLPDFPWIRYKRTAAQVNRIRIYGARRRRRRWRRLASTSNTTHIQRTLDANWIGMARTNHQQQQQHTFQSARALLIICSSSAGAEHVTNTRY